MIVFLVVGILVGAGVGIGVGYVMFDSDDAAAEETYWFYVDYGDKTDATHVNGWYSGTGTSLNSAIDGALASLDFKRNSYDMAGEINGIGGDVGYSWMSWVWMLTTYENDFDGCWVGDKGVTVSIGNAMYLGYSVYDAFWNPVLDPYDDESWDQDGPFKA